MRQGSRSDRVGWIRIVGIESAARICEAAKHPESFVSLGRAEHPLTRPRDAHFAGRMLAAWTHRYIGLRGPAPVPPTSW